MTRLLAALPLLFLSGAVFGKTFECTEAFATVFEGLADEKALVLVVATVNADGKTGTIEVADRTFKAKYQVEGFDRTWRFFTADNQEFGYLFLISPDGTSAYYDHETSKGEVTDPEQAYICNDAESNGIDTAQASTESVQASAESAYIFAIQQKIRIGYGAPR